MKLATIKSIIALVLMIGCAKEVEHEWQERNYLHTPGLSEINYLDIDGVNISKDYERAETSNGDYYGLFQVHGYRLENRIK